MINAHAGLTSTPADAFFMGASADLSHVVFSEGTPLTANAPAGGVEDLYEWDEGVVRLLTVLPDGLRSRVRSRAVRGRSARTLFFTAGGDL